MANVAKLKKLRKFILDEPRRYQQAYWFLGKNHPLFQKTQPPCGTMGCLAGMACFMEGYKPTQFAGGKTATATVPGSRETVEVYETAMKILGLTTDVADALFSGDCCGYLWRGEPFNLYYRGVDNNDPVMRAKAAAMVLDVLIK